MAKQTHIGIGGMWKPLVNIYKGVGGIWKPHVIPKVGISGSWKECMEYAEPTLPAISGLVLHLDATQGITKDANDKVSVWADQSIEGNDAAQATHGNQPLWVDDVLDGKPVVDFTASSKQHLVNETFNAISELSDATIFTVMRGDPGTNQIPYSAHNNPLTVQYHGGRINIYVSGARGYFAWTSDPVLMSGVFDGSLTGNAERLKMWLDGTQRDLAFVGTVGATLPVSTGYKVGRSFAHDTAYHDDILAEILIYNTALSTADRQAVESYLTNKWGL